MTLKIKVPHLPESVSDATLITWHKSVGDNVLKNDSLVDLETDKVTLEVVAPQSGVLREILKTDGAIVTSGEILALLEVKDIPIETAQLVDEEDFDNPLTPSIRRLLREHDLDASEIIGTGKDGRLTKSDVLNVVNQRALQEAEIIAPAVDSEPLKELEPTTPVQNLRPEQRVPMTRLRAKVAERLLQAQQNAAMLTTFNEVNMQNVIELRNQYKGRFEKKHGVKLGFMSFFVKASIEALKRFPVVNASIDDNDIIYHGFYDIGIAVSTEKGLIVP
jgi:2-oxoglutarate dehydrogenase E2 component (dihydrolipoamide succinyltransferase)